MAERDSDILMRYRGAPEERERAIMSGSQAVKDFLSQFERGDDFAEAATQIAVALGSTAHERLGEESTRLHMGRGEAEFPVDPVEAAKAMQGLQWLAQLTGVEAVREASLARQRSKL